MSLKDEYDFSTLVNETVAVVIEELEEQLNEEINVEVCRCDDCIMDMAAMALNQLEPAYHSSFTGVIYAQKFHTGAFQEKVNTIVKKAIAKVRKNPSHAE
jgi:competence protein ComFB